MSIFLYNSLLNTLIITFINLNFFKLNETGIACGDTEAILTGQTFPMPVTDIQGTDSFTTENC